MRRVRSALAVLLALLWVPLTSHCRIEAIPGFEFLRCAVESPAAEPSSEDCGDDECSSVESAKYQAPRPQGAWTPVVVAVLTDQLASLIARPEASEPSLGPQAVAPPLLLSSCNFLLRTALPIRAPSRAS